jgi:hypothetical protein
MLAHRNPRYRYSCRRRCQNTPVSRRPGTPHGACLLIPSPPSGVLKRIRRKSMIACSGYRPTLATVNAEWLQSQVSLLIGNLAAELHDSSREADLGRSLDRSIHDYRRNWLTVYFEYHFFVGPCSIATAGKRELALFSMKISARNFMSAIIMSSLFALMSILPPVTAAAADLRGQAAAATAPEIWFGGIPPFVRAKLFQETQSDYMDLFRLDAPWSRAASHVQFF